MPWKTCGASKAWHVEWFPCMLTLLFKNWGLACQNPHPSLHEKATVAYIRCCNVWCNMHVTIIDVQYGTQAICCLFTSSVHFSCSFRCWTFASWCLFGVTSSWAKPEASSTKPSLSPTAGLNSCGDVEPRVGQTSYSSCKHHLLNRFKHKNGTLIEKPGQIHHPNVKTGKQKCKPRHPQKLERPLPVEGHGDHGEKNTPNLRYVWIKNRCSKWSCCGGLSRRCPPAI